MGFKHHDEEILLIDIEDMEFLVNRMVEEATDFLETIDTARLNEFTMNRDVVILYMAHIMLFSGKHDMHMIKESRSSIAFSTINIKLDTMLELNQPSDVQFDAYKKFVYSEAIFWLSFHSDAYYLTVVYNAKADGKAETEHLEKVYNHPHATPYFLQDIWDLPFIEQCITHGIDPELAKFSNRENNNGE